MKKETRGGLAEHYANLPEQSSPKTDFIADLSRACKVKEATARNWVKGRAVPKEQWQLEEISKLTKIPVEELF